MKKFVTLFPGTKNIHLVKDLGMIPYMMHKLYGYDSSIACYNNDNYEYIQSEVKGLKIDFINKVTGNNIFDGILYLIKKAKSIDVLNLYHLDRQTLSFIIVYKLINKRGNVYLKMDGGLNLLNELKKNNIKKSIMIRILRKCKMISVETQYSCNEIKKLNLEINIKYIPNGCINESSGTYKEKEKIILTVGRIGSYEKNNEVLLEAYKKASPYIKDWKLLLVGPIEEKFDDYINKYFEENSNLKNNIIFTGPINDRKELFDIYKKSKIFCLTSRYESFGLVLVEAMSEGCFLITSDVEAADEITNNNTYGKIFTNENSRELAELFIRYCNDEEFLKCKYEKNLQYYEENFTLKKACNKINELLESGEE